MVERLPPLYDWQGATAQVHSCVSGRSGFPIGYACWHYKYNLRLCLAPDVVNMLQLSGVDALGSELNTVRPVA